VSEGPEVTLIDTTVLTQFIDEITQNGTYYYAIRATNESGCSQFSDCYSVHVTLYPPASYIPPKPILHPIVPYENTNGSIMLTWDSIPIADNYSTYRSLEPITGEGSGVILINITINTYFEDTVIFGGIYYYAIRATNESGISPFSDCYSVIVSFLPTWIKPAAFIIWTPTTTLVVDS
jgi:hypothetical protein